MPDTTRGNFIAGRNRGKPPGSNHPDFTGRLSIPGREEEQAMALWIHKDRNQQTYFSGRIDEMPLTDDVVSQIEQSSSAIGLWSGASSCRRILLRPYREPQHPRGLRARSERFLPLYKEERH